MIRGSHPDGTCDDYFPYERAMGALVFSLYAGTEAYRLLGLRDEAVVEFFLKRVRHLANHNETGQLTNHQAFAALAAYNVFLITGDDKCRRVSEDRTQLALDWQHSEGWFQEYEERTRVTIPAPSIFWRNSNKKEMTRVFKHR